jgi:hypothetical protein
MNSQEINMTIEKALGGYVASNGCVYRSKEAYDENMLCGGHPVRDFIYDLNACAEFEKTIKGHHLWGEYKRLLSVLCYTGIDYPVDATAAQRCEAFLKTKGLWTP